MIRFFALHDYDRSHSLDGIELTGALTSYYDYGIPVDGNELEEMSHEERTMPLLLQEEAEAIVDRILKDHDANGDGYLTFAELKANQDGIWNTLDLVDELDDADDDDGDEDDIEGEDAVHNVSWEYSHEIVAVPCLEFVGHQKQASCSKTLIILFGMDPLMYAFHVAPYHGAVASNTIIWTAKRYHGANHLWCSLISAVSQVSTDTSSKQDLYDLYDLGLCWPFGLELAKIDMIWDCAGHLA